MEDDVWVVPLAPSAVAVDVVVEVGKVICCAMVGPTYLSVMKS